MAKRKTAQSEPSAGLRFGPLLADCWDDFEALFGARGACGGCWCMTPRLASRDYEAGKGAGNRAAMRARVEAGPPPGMLGYRDGAVVAWISIEPRDRFPRLATSRVLAPIDEREVWSITCFFLARSERGRGTTVRALEAAAAWVAAQGGTCLEGYPIDPRPGASLPAVFAYTGLYSAFLAAGFHEVARRSPTRPIMRRELV